ncbi:phage-associated protein, BcepMu gp16 family [Acinetobacter baumannii]|nr:phage-associated protein, BcepMu gp16 family [Acinetobacter baumannii]
MPIRYFFVKFIQNSSDMIKSIKQVRDDFIKSGISIAEWARDNNFSPDLVYRILKNNKVPRRGESHKIAVKLGIKEQKDMD